MEDDEEYTQRIYKIITEIGPAIHMKSGRDVLTALFVIIHSIRDECGDPSSVDELVQKLVDKMVGIN